MFNKYIQPIMLALLSIFFLSSCAGVGGSYHRSLSSWPIASEQANTSLDQTVGLVSRRSFDHFGCSGVILSSYYVLTAEHCIDNDQRTIFGETIPGPTPIGNIHRIITHRMYLATEMESSIEYEVVSADGELDLALLRRVGEFVGGWSAVERRVTPVELGELLYGIGHPNGVNYNVTYGHMSSISRHWGDMRVDRIFSSVPIYYGNSGGPLFDSEGNLVGICSIMVGTPHLNGSVYLTSINEFLNESLPRPYLTQDAVKPL